MTCYLSPVTRSFTKDVTLKTRLTRDIEINIPLLSAAMDTVTEARLAVPWRKKAALALFIKT